jgi:hypothetical protein
MNKIVSSRFAPAVASALLLACGSGSTPGATQGSPGNDTGGERSGQVSLAIATVPQGVQCIQITATGSYTVTQNFAAMPDAGVGSLALGELPLGSVAITGQAFNAPCASIGSAQPSWVADKQVVALQAGVITSLTITFRPDNPVGGTPSFVGNIVQVAIGTAIAVVLSDGTVEAAGDLGGSLYNAPTFGVVRGLSNVAQLALPTDGLFGCALLKNGTVECWGNNLFGQLGNGTTTASSTPVAVPGLSNVVQIAAGGSHVCAVQSDGTASCWGYNAYGQIGNNATTNVLSPTPVQHLVTSIACGLYHTCSIGNGSIPYCWGHNTYGQIGNNTTTDSNVPQSLFMFLGGAMTQVSLGYFHTCALRADGSVFCWGNNADGRLGIGSFTNALVPTQVTISNIQQIALNKYASCGRRGDGTVWCWGDDSAGELGDGAFKSEASPVQVPGLPASVGVTAGSENACSMGTDLSIECWGDNSLGQLGNGTYILGWVPVPIKL